MRADEAAALVAALVAAFPETMMSAETLQLYARFLVDAKAEHAAAAVATWIARERRFPRISELREAVERERGGAPPDIDQAWSEALRAARAGRAPARWSHEAVRLAVAAIGFDDLRRSDNQAADRAHFAKAYEAAQRRTRDAGHRQLVQGVVKDMRQLMAAPAELRAQNEAGASRPQLTRGNEHTDAAAYAATTQKGRRDGKA
jgi:hypothetical protein